MNLFFHEYQESITAFDLRTAKRSLRAELSLMTKAYYSDVHQFAALIYPAAYTIKCLWNAYNIMRGCIFFLSALFYEPCESVPQVIHGLCLEVLALIANAINTFISLISLLIRSIVTLCYGYLETRKAGDEINTSLIGEQPEYNKLVFSFWKTQQVSEPASTHFPEPEKPADYFSPSCP